VNLQADVAIVGGGLIGCMTAYYLRRRGRSVAILERGYVGGQSSGVSFGSLRLQGQNGAGLALALRAQAIWETLEAELGEPLEFTAQGLAHLALTPEHVGRLQANAASLVASGLHPELLDQAETKRRWPFLGAAVLAASFSPRDATVNPRLVTPAFARAVRRLGGAIHEGCAVVAIEAGGAGFVTRFAAPDGTGGTLTSGVLVNAAGVWGGMVAGWFGETIPCFAAGPAEMVTEPVPPFAASVMHVVDGSVLFRQTARGNVVIGGHPRMSIDAETRRARVPPDKIATNLARLVAIVPHMRAHQVIRTWTGIEGYLPDMMPALGPSARVPGLFHACAFSGHGLQVGPAVGMALADLVVDGVTDMPIAPFGVERLRSSVAGERMTEEFQPDIRSGSAG
jgi:sarcosine oxidase subunit beta